VSDSLPAVRADHIGSLLRPAALVKAREDFEAGRIDRDGLTEAENVAIADVVKMQEDVGLKFVTDGEFRRFVYSDSFTSEALDGVEIELSEEQGWSKSDQHGHRTARRIPKVTGPVRWKGDKNARDFAELNAVTRAIGKVTLPGPAYIHYRAGRLNISDQVYPGIDAFWDDMVAAYHRELASLAAAGCTFVQLDETSLVKLGDDRARQLLADRGDHWEDLLETYIRVVNEVVAGKPDDMTIGVHICRSQDPSWQANVGYDPIADAVFNRMNVPVFYLEYEGERSGTFDPLRFVPKDKTIVLGLVATYDPELESIDFLRRRIDEAGQFIDISQLGLSPQCGFATLLSQERVVSEDMQRAKLARIVEVANLVWPNDA